MVLTLTKMSKRFFPQQQGDRKRTKLDISISDHNFPLSQNREPEQSDTWGDDNDDEILLLASQACEDAYNINDVSVLPDYTICMQPGSTSTQMSSSPGPSTSKTEFTFKKPSSHPPSVLSTQLKEKCNRISSPLPGITAKILPKATEPAQSNLSDDLIFNNKIYQGQDSDQVYRQLLQLQEENAKLKSENGKLLEKCVTKEGEASILRTQLKTCQVSVDNARLEKIKAQEKVQMEWTEKLAAANTQMHDLKTQLDFKNLEIISIRERCKKLESSKVRLTQVTVGNNDISSRPNTSYTLNESLTQNRRVKTSSNAVQTDDKAHFLYLNKISRPDVSILPSLLPQILETTATPHSLLEYNEKLTHTAIHKCRVYSTFHRVPNKTVTKEEKNSLQLSAVYEDIIKIANGSEDWENYCNVFRAAKITLDNTLSRLKALSNRVTTAFQKEMDEKYIETTCTYLDVRKEDLLKGRALYKEEQEILTRRMIGVLSHILEASSSIEMFKKFMYSDSAGQYFVESMNKICSLLDTTCTAPLHSGLLVSLAYSIQPLVSRAPNTPTILEIIKNIITSRPMPFVCCRVLALVKELSLHENFRKEFCPRTSVGNLKMDYDQGVLLYKKDSCYLQILFKQIEACLKCIESQELQERAMDTARHLAVLYTNMNRSDTNLATDKSRCDCQLVLIQVTVYALRICAVMLKNSKNVTNDSDPLLSVCLCGVQILYQCSLRDIEFSSQLAHNEGHLIEFCEIMQEYQHDEVHSNMLSELAGTLQSTPEDIPTSFHRQPWLKSFESFSMVD